MWSSTELIVAPATVPGPGARAIVRLAGEGLDALLPRLFVAEGTGFCHPGEAPRVVRVRLAASGLGRDWGEVPLEILHWPGPGGPIGGPLVEVQVPASVPLVAAVVAEACRHGARMARGGEFTLRAFLAGRLDLVQAEAVLAVVDASTPAELSAALDRMAGGAGLRLTAARSVLLDLLADIEAAIDFADETTPDAVPAHDAATWRRVRDGLAAAATVIDDTAAGLARRDASAVADLPRVVLAGRPNIGKSSLFNAVVGHAAALVADDVGTTRDWLEAPLPSAARPACMLVDLAGLPADPETARDAIDARAIAAARGELSRADVVVICRDTADPAWPGVQEAARAAHIRVVTRIDRAPDRLDRGEPDAIGTSSATNEGVAALRAAILAAVAAVPPRPSPATSRMALGLAAAGRAVAEARGLVAACAEPDEALVAGCVRRAVESLGEVTGVDVGVDLLDRIFSRHCIGK